MSLSTIAVTGGNGKIGRAILEDLATHGYETVNISRGKQREEVSDTYITTDLLDPGQTYGALAMSEPDAVIHMGTIPNPYSHQEYRTYKSNTMSAMHLLEASEALGLESCCLASSINAMGAEHQVRPPQVDYLPIDEAHPRTPDDVYGIAKHAMEITADGFGRRPDSNMTISTLRYPWVPDEQEVIENFAEADRSMAAIKDDNPWSGRDVMFSYIHMADATALARKAVEAKYDGHESFWAVAGDTTAAVPTTDVITEFFPEAELRGEFAEYDTLFDLSKAERLLGWTPEHSWRDY
ncbi:NAD(P)-dependent oxidoreductase [Halococcus sp. PRR34]|uniref:NAD-dependent epimerase/dehydratase family protein n=1 Tax=Halococcus sp. PRR34 TaxID=3020830 RepID=UPI002362AA02|nr:NAD(P)-dependent oxidoreductase [Halococcus sp. PRR34]